MICLEFQSISLYSYFLPVTKKTHLSPVFLRTFHRWQDDDNFNGNAAHEHQNLGDGPWWCLLIFRRTQDNAHTVDGSEIPNNHLGYVKTLVNNGINYLSQVSYIYFPTIS